MIAICRGRELGIDLEQLRPIGEAERIVESFFSANEQAEFAGIASEARARRICARMDCARRRSSKGWGLESPDWRTAMKRDLAQAR